MHYGGEINVFAFVSLLCSVWSLWHYMTYVFASRSEMCGETMES